MLMENRLLMFWLITAAELFRYILFLLHRSHTLCKKFARKTKVIGMQIEQEKRNAKCILERFFRVSLQMYHSEF